MESVTSSRRLLCVVNVSFVMIFAAAFAALVFARGGAFPVSRSVASLVLILVAFAQALFLLLTGRGMRRTQLDFPVLLLCAVFAAAIFYSHSAERSWSEFNNVLTYALTFVFVAQVVSEKKDGRVFTGALVAVGLFFALQNIYLAVSQVPGAIYIEEARVRLLGTFGYANIFAIFLVMIIPLAVHLATTARNALWEAALAVVGASLFLALMLTYSRGAILTAFGVLIFMLVMVPRAIRLRCLKNISLIALPVLVFGDEIAEDAFIAATYASRSDHRLALISFLMVIAAVLGSTGLSVGLLSRPASHTAPSLKKLSSVLFLVLVIYGAAFGVVAGSERFRGNIAHVANTSLPRERITQSQTQNVLSLSDTRQPQRKDRIWLWGVSRKSIEKNPLFGTGPGTFSLSFLRCRDKPLEAIDPHNMYLRLLTEVGIIGFLPFGIILATFLFFIAKIVARRVELDPDSPIPAYAAGGFGFLAHSAIDTEWLFPAVVILFFMYLGFVYSFGESEVSRNGRIKAFFVLFACMISLLSISVPLHTEIMLTSGKNAIKKLHWQEAEKRFNRATALNPVSATARTELAKLCQTMYHVSGDSEYLRLSQTEYLGALRLDSHDSRRYLQVAEFLNMEYKDRRGALKFYQKAVALDPYDPAPHLQMRDIYLTLGEFDKANQAELKGNHLNWLLGQILEP